jgi:hypothetical protein
MTVTEVTKSTIVQSIWNNFYDRISANVKNVTLSDSSKDTIKTYTAAFPSKSFESKTNFPIVVIDTPEFSTDFRTWTRSIAEGTISLEVYTTKAESADKFVDAMINSIETYKKDLRDAGIRMIELDSMDNDMVENGRMKIHMRRMTFTFQFVYDKTLAY